MILSRALEPAVGYFPLPRPAIRGEFAACVIPRPANVAVG